MREYTKSDKIEITTCGGKKMKKISVFVVCICMLMTVGCSKSLKVTVKENIELEYGEKPDNSLLFDKEQSDEDVVVKEVKNFDSKKTGEQEITVIFTNADEKTKEETLKVTVKDTKKPVIKLKKDKLEISEGDQFDATANIESVKDPVDGDIKKSDDKKLTKNGYLIASDVDAKKAGSYTVKITAFDSNGNKAESSYKVTVNAKPQEPVAQQPAYQTSNQSNGNNEYTNNQGSSSSNSKPVSNNSGSSNHTAQSKPQQPASTKKVCPNGKEPENPNLPCDTILTGREDNYSQEYKDASGNVITFPTSQDAYIWANNAWLSGEIKESYSSYVTTPLWRNDKVTVYGVTFMK